MRTFNMFVHERLNAMWRTVENSSLTSTSLETEIDVQSEDDESDESMVGEDFDDESDSKSVIYGLSTEDSIYFRRIRILDRINSENVSSYFTIRVGDSEKFMHKQTACWLSTDEKKTLSADRLQRV